MAYPVFTEKIEKQQHIRTSVSFSSIEEFPDSTNPFRQRNSMPPVSSSPADEGDDRTTTVVRPNIESTPFSPLRLNVSASKGRDSLNTEESDDLDEPTPSSPKRLIVSGYQSQYNGSPNFVARRPGGGVPDRLDTYKRNTTSISPVSLDMDMSLGSADRDHHDDDNMIVGSPSVATSVTASVSQVTPDNHPVEEGRGWRSRSNSSGRARQRRHGRKTAGRRTSSNTRRLAMCGTLGLNLDDEIRASVRDVADSVRQIFTTVKRFGPKERDAVRATLLEAQDFIKEKIVEKCRNTLLSERVACGMDDVMASCDVSDDGSMSPVRDSKPNGDTRARQVRERDIDRPTSQRGRKSSSSDDIDDMSSTSPKECLDAQVLYSMPIENFVHPRKMF